MKRIGACLLFLAACVACRGGAERAGAGDGDGGTGTSRGAPCGPLECRQYDTLAEAFESALASHPRVVAIGEAHAQKGTAVSSSAKHFTEEVLPHLGGRASDLLLEILKPPAGCGETTAAVRQEHEVVTKAQAPTDQGEYVTMGERARAIGVVPDLLRPTCADLAAIKAATDDPISPSLETIARLTRIQVEKLVDRDARSDADVGKFVITYGGALHNDLDPPKERAAWSFARELDAYVGGRYVAIELFLPELIDDSPSWKEREFTRYYDPGRLGTKPTVYRTGKTFVIVLPRGEAK
jgi:hypothetical protein